MKALIVTIFTLMILTKCLSQDHYVSHIDFNNTGQFAWQMEQIDDNFLLAIQTSCFESENSCGGIINISSNGVIIDEFVKEDLSGNSQVFIKSENQIFYNGEFNLGPVLEMSLFILGNRLQEQNNLNYSQNNTKYYNYFATGITKIDTFLFTLGSSFATNECPQIGHIYRLNITNFDIDTSILLSFVEDGYHVPHLLGSNSSKDLISVTYYKDFISDKIYYKIVGFDTAFNQTFEWSREVEGNSIPRGCVTRDDNMIISVPEGIGGSKKNIYCIDTTGQTLWVWNWDANEALKTNILRIEEAKNGDLFVMGQIVSAELFDGDLRNTAFVMRLSPDGNTIWRRFFRINDPDTRLRNYVSDLVELETGDLQLTGQSRRIVYDPEFGDFRPDQDILWARIGGDGCINGDCSEVYLISKTNDFQTEKERVISIYPNPIVDGQLTIDVKGHSIKAALIYDLSGQLIMHQNLEYGNTSVSLEGNNSIFLIRIVDEEGRLVHSEKVIRI